MCSFESCNKPVLYTTGLGAGLCNGHRQQKLRGKELTQLKYKSKKSQTLEERLLVFIDKTDTCWIWTGAIGSKGYGTIKHQGKTRNVHRVVYTLWVQDIPDGSVVHHTCGVRHCVNPAHLQAVTPHENNAEMLERNIYKRKINNLEKQVKLLEKELKKADHGK